MERRRSGRTARGPAGQPEILGFLGEGACVTGELSLQEGFRVDGRVVGKISSTSDLIVGPPGRVEAEELRVRSLSVSGVVRGDLHVAERLEIHPGGKVSGRVRLYRPGLVMVPGGEFEGTLQMEDEPEATPAQEATGETP